MSGPHVTPISEVPAIPPIGDIGDIPPITDIPGVQDISPPGLLAFKFGDLPSSVQPLVKKGTSAWPKAVDEAIAKGIKDVDKLADLIFFMHHPERVGAGGVGKPIDPDEKGAVRLLAERRYYGVVAQRRLTPTFVPPVFLPERRSSQYEEHVAATTTGVITLMINGRIRPKSGKPTDVADTFKDMQANVEKLQAGDTIYLATWEFEALDVPLVDPKPPDTWGALLKQKAIQGVRIRVIASIHPNITNYGFTRLDDLIRSLPADKRDNLQYLASAHPGSFILGAIPAADHHQKFMIVKREKTTIAWCGGLDITQARTPAYWQDNFVWHDIHARLEGKIVKDLELEFVERWNREKDAAMTSHCTYFDEASKTEKEWEAKNIVSIWKSGFETLKASPVGSADTGSGINTHDLQMLRTVAIPGPLFPPTRRDDIWQGYFRLIGRASRFLFLENQYFHEPRLAAALVTQLQAQPSLIVIVVIATGNNDPTVHPYVKHVFTLRHEFFQKLLSDRTLAKRIGVYTMFYPSGIVHSKLIIADDEALSMGSANATQRSFYLDSELNVMLENPRVVKDFRVKLWAHDLGETETEVAKWSPSDFIKRWGQVAAYNKARRAKPATMVGEGIDEYLPLSDKDPKSIVKLMKVWPKVLEARKRFPFIDFDVAF